MKFVINRKKWRCGGNGNNKVGKGSTSLLNQQGYMCCLGQCALQVGAKKSDIRDASTPENTDKLFPGLSKKSATYIVDTSLSNNAVSINDDENLTQKERERKLRSLFSKYKHKLVFTGKYK